MKVPRFGAAGTDRQALAMRSEGRMKHLEDTSALTGLPGRVTIGVPATRPTPWGIPGCIATLTNSTPGHR